MDKIIYLDYQGTTPCRGSVLEAMLPYFGETFGNPSSSLSSFGRTAAEAVQRGRDQVAQLIGARPGEIVLSGSATESINLAIQGAVRAMGRNSLFLERRRMVTTAIEHKAVIESARALGELGWSVEVLPVEANGRLPLGALEKALRAGVGLVSVQAASQEIATKQDIKKLAAQAHNEGALVHCDASQAVGKILVDVVDWDVDLLSFSGHKMYGPKGVGVLYVRNGVEASALEPIIHGGGQEFGLRSGTQNVPAIVGLGEACRLASKLMKDEAVRLRSYRDHLEELLTSALDVQINGDLSNRLPGATSLTFKGIDAEALIFQVPELMLSTGSACTSGAPEPSHVLTAIGLSREDAESTIRLSFGRDSDGSMPPRVAELLVAAVNRLQGLS